MEKYSLKDIETTFKERSWWAIVASLIPSKYITYYIANNTKITPNQITFLSAILSLIAGILFYNDYYILGAILFQIGYILDIVDGSLARVKNMQSRFGAFFDVFTDWLKAPLVLIILFWHLDKINFLVFIFFFLFLSCLVNKYNDMLYFQGAKSLSNEINNRVNKSKSFSYLSFMKDKNIIAFPSTIEFEALLLFFYPIFKWDVFIYLAFAILIFNILLKFYIILKKI